MAALEDDAEVDFGLVFAETASLRPIIHGSRGVLDLSKHTEVQLDQSAALHCLLVQEGRCEAPPAAGDRAPLSEGDMLVLAGRHDRLRLRPRGSAKVAIVAFRPGDGRELPLALPASTAVVVRGKGSAWPGLLPQLEHPTETSTERLLQGLFFEVMLRGLGLATRQDGGALAADPRIARVAQALADAPGRPWTVEDMAREAFMSRAAFARRFVEVTGEPPMQRLTRIRLDRAADTLRNEPMQTIATIAERFGYANESSFTKAFRRQFGHSPRKH